MNNKTTFWNFINRYKVEIPIIQRDYAQGRLGKEVLRKSFLSDIKSALDGRSGEMKLDFVYGSTDDDKLNPLDGQQRLTTLWLLHWYIALSAGVLTEENCAILRKFTYETRISSREFCQNLCNPLYFESFTKNDESIVDYITRQTWFYSAWKQDPTIQSMMRMLGGSEINGYDKTKKFTKKEKKEDGIREIFEGSTEKFKVYWEKLISPTCPIAFYYLPLSDFGLSDDLYIKMNARGKQLTSFENFKADLIGYIIEQSTNENLQESDRNQWKNLLDPTTGLPIKLDTSWAEIFWKARSKGIQNSDESRMMKNQIDEIYFAFINRLFWNFLFLAKNSDKQYILKVGEGILSNGARTYTIENENISYRMLNKDRYDHYESLDAYKYAEGSIPVTFFNNMSNIFNRYLQYNGELPSCVWNPDFSFVPYYKWDDTTENNVIFENEDNEKILEISSLSQIYRIVFFAICKYFLDGEGNKDSFNRWLRVIWNLVSGEASDGNPQIRSTQAMRSAIEYISGLESHRIYESLIEKGLLNKDNLTEFEARYNEEVVKADQIINGSRSDGQSWEQIIKRAEATAFFKGTIRFLFQDETGAVNWDYFDRKFDNAKKYFECSNSIAVIELARYCSEEQIKDIWSIYSFDKKNWKTILLQESIKEPIHNFLMGNRCENASVLFFDINNIINAIEAPYVKLIQDWKCCHVVLTNYSTKRNEPYNGFVYEVGNRTRTDFNDVISKVNDIQKHVPQGWGEEAYVINGHVYYRGLWLDFAYKNYYFRYYGNNTICLMESEWVNQKHKQDGSTYYFEVNNKTLKDVESELDRLIDELEK